MAKNYVTVEHFDEVIEAINNKFEKIDHKLDKLDKLSEQMDWLIGKYQTHDEEHTLINNTLSDHSDNLEIINGKLGITL